MYTDNLFYFKLILDGHINLQMLLLSDQNLYIIAKVMYYQSQLKSAFLETFMLIWNHWENVDSTNVGLPSTVRLL